MSYTPDVPSTALGPNEYNVGLNIETSTRGIKSVAGTEQILKLYAPGPLGDNYVPGTPIYLTGGFRDDEEFWFVVATLEGRWYTTQGGADPTYQYWVEITPYPVDQVSGAVPAIVGYTRDTRFTESWNGTTLIVNDTINPPMYLPGTVDAFTALIFMGDSRSIPINAIATGAPAAGQITVTYTGAPLADGQFGKFSYVTLSGVTPASFNGSWRVLYTDDTELHLECPITDVYVSGGVVQSSSIWNYNPDWTSVTAAFVRMYSTPNVGSILVAGDLTITGTNTVTTRFGATVQWSQAFGLNQVPATWEPTILNVANQLEVPVRGPVRDAFPANGQFFICSYWDTVVFSPINYSTTSAPIIGVRLFNTGRGLLGTNAFANTDRTVYGVDARDIWVFDGNDFQGLGNQRVRNWFFDQIDPAYSNRVFMQNNTFKNQIEIYYPTDQAVNGVPNYMLAYRYDLDVWQAPREVGSVCQATESPVWSFGFGSTNEWTPDYASRCIVLASGVDESYLTQKDQGYGIDADATVPTAGTAIVSQFRRDNIKLLPDYSGKMMVHRILPEVTNQTPQGIAITPGPGTLTITIEGANSVGSTPTAKTPVTIPVDADGSYNQNPWAQINQNAFRVNTIELGNTSNTNIWMCSATTWQFTQVEDDR
jgi:hypothetical protein